MDKNQEKQLKRITDEFTKGMGLFNKKECQQALKIFSGIIAKYKDSGYYNILEIRARAKVYKKICDARITPVKIELHDDKDYLYNGIFHLNAGEYDKALERFDYLEEKKYDDPFLDFLMSLVHLKLGDMETSMGYLRTAIEKDEFYKVIAYNDPDLDPLSENEEFASLIE